jgi:hypothetical protein
MELANHWPQPENPFVAVAHLNAGGAYAKTNAREPLDVVGVPGRAVGPDFGAVR